jgi:hypothetical protein
MIYSIHRLKCPVPSNRLVGLSNNFPQKLLILRIIEYKHGGGEGEKDTHMHSINYNVRILFI